VTENPVEQAVEELPETDLVVEVFTWLNDNRAPIDAACDQLGIPRPPPT
jgi:hypothetical protein